MAVVVRCRPLPVGEEDRLQIGVEEGANGQATGRLVRHSSRNTLCVTPIMRCRCLEGQ